MQADDATGLLEHPERLRVAGSDADPGRPVQPGRDPLDIERVRAAALGGGARAVDAGQRITQRPDRDGDRGDGEYGDGADEGDEATHWGP